MEKFPLIASLGALALFAAPCYAADLAAGKALAQESCTDCHGDDGAGDDDYPPIKGMSVEKFSKAMREYQDGTRKDKKATKMVKEAKKLTPAQVADLAAYFATFK
jgi:cytochrome c553